jgi:hypothetical protein
MFYAHQVYLSQNFVNFIEIAIRFKSVWNLNLIYSNLSIEQINTDTDDTSVFYV